MTWHLTREELQSFRRHTIDPQKLLRADRHLAGCSQCQRELRSAGSAPIAPGIVQECEEPLHPSYEQITAYIDSGEQSEWIERHMQCCLQCAIEVRDLKDFDAHMEVPAKAVEAPKASWLQWLSGFFATPERPRFVAASLSVLLLGFLAMAQLKVGAPTGIESQTILEDAVRSHPGQFYGSVALVAIGLAGVLYRISRKK